MQTQRISVSLLRCQATSKSHLQRLLQRSSHSCSHHLLDVHLLLEAMLKKHHDPTYLIDTPENLKDDPSINYLNFQVTLILKSKIKL